MALEVIAPGKLNLSLEVISRRPDGYHELVSLMQTLDLCDRLVLEEETGVIELEVSGDAQQGLPHDKARNLAFRAAEALREAADRPDLGVAIHLEKRIPASQGLGGGSSDAAAVLRGLNHLWSLGFDHQKLSGVAAGIGSDVSFFLYGGAALVSGRGEVVEPLPDLADPLDLVLFLPATEIEQKTARAYRLLSPGDFTNGSRTRLAAETIRQGLPLDGLDLKNVFDRHIAGLVPQLSGALQQCHAAGVPVMASGAGPGFFARLALSDLPEALLHDLDPGWGIKAMACRGLSREESLVVREV